MPGFGQQGPSYLDSIGTSSVLSDHSLSPQRTKNMLSSGYRLRYAASPNSKTFTVRQQRSQSSTGNTKPASRCGMFSIIPRFLANNRRQSTPQYPFHMHIPCSPPSQSGAAPYNEGDIYSGAAPYNEGLLIQNLLGLQHAGPEVTGRLWVHRNRGLVAAPRTANSVPPPRSGAQTVPPMSNNVRGPNAQFGKSSRANLPPLASAVSKPPPDLNGFVVTSSFRCAHDG